MSKAKPQNPLKWPTSASSHIAHALLIYMTIDTT